MQAILLHIELKYPLENSQHKLSKVLARLPEGTEKVMHAEKSVGFLIPAIDHIPKITGSIRYLLDEFENWRAIGLSGEAFCKDGSMDPLAYMLAQWKPKSVAVPVRQRTKPEHVALPQRGKPGLQSPVKHFIGRTVRKMVLEGRPGQYRTKQTDEH